MSLVLLPFFLSPGKYFEFSLASFSVIGSYIKLQPNPMLCCAHGSSSSKVATAGSYGCREAAGGLLKGRQHLLHYLGNITAATMDLDTCVRLPWQGGSAGYGGRSCCCFLPPHELDLPPPLPVSPSPQLPQALKCFAPKQWQYALLGALWHPLRHWAQQFLLLGKHEIALWYVHYIQSWWYACTAGAKRLRTGS